MNLRLGNNTQRNATMIDKSLREKILDAPFIIRDYVNDEPECNYERYLTELINHSAFFMKKSEETVFEWVEHQDHGECDSVSENYSIDYKLFVTRSRLHGLKVTSNRITKYKDGMIGFGTGRWPAGKSFRCFRTIAALRPCSIEDLNRMADTPDGDVEKELSIILKSLRVKKNLLLFYPYTLSFSEVHTFEDGCKSILEAFNEDLSNIIAYRKTAAPGFDTFLCTIYDKNLLIFELIGDLWELVDFVELKQSKIYMDLYYTYGNDGFNY